VVWEETKNLEKGKGQLVFKESTRLGPLENEWSQTKWHWQVHFKAKCEFGPWNAKEIWTFQSIPRHGRVGRGREVVHQEAGADGGMETLRHSPFVL
jgi:hypothetical protein